MSDREKEIQVDYYRIVGPSILPEYRSPEEFGNSIKKFSLLKPIKEIVYSNQTSDLIVE